MAKKLYVRFSTTQDEQKVFDFYAKNQHEFIFLRDPDVWKERISTGAVTIIEDEKGEIVASSISYPILQKDEQGNDIHMWTEIGSTRITLGGIGLVTPLVSAQMLRAFLLEPPKDRFALEIIKGNTHSEHVFKKMGATSANVPKELIDEVKTTIAPGSGQAPVNWFQIGAEAIPDLAKHIQNKMLRNKQTGEEYDLDFSRCLLITHFKKEIEKLSKENFGDPKKPDPKKSFHSIQKKFKP